MKEKRSKYTLVWEFKGKAIFIEGNLKDAKEYSEYMELWFEALEFIEQKGAEQLKNILNPIKK